MTVIFQERAYQEVSDVLQDDKPLEFNNLSDLKYIERVLKESLRIYPSVPTISRTTSDDIKIDDYIIPKGTSVAMHIFDIHRNPKYFPHPTKFDPDRFLPENSKDRHPYAFIPFSAGPRNCIGQKFALMEEKILLSYILKNYKVTSTQTVDNVNPVVELILRPHEGLFFNDSSITLLETAMGIQVAAMSEKDNSYVKAVLGLCGEVSNRTAKPWLGYDRIYYNSSHGKRYLEYLSVLHNMTRKMIHERKNLRQQQTSEKENVTEDDYGRKKRRAFLDLLLDVSNDGKVLTVEEMREEEKVYQEIIQVCDVDTPLQFADLSELKYLERVLKESLRMYPSVPTIARMTSEDMKIDQYIIPKGVTVALHIYDVHRNPKFYPNPEKFDPDRFLPENSKDRHPYAYIPFSAGPRNCIGQKFALAEEKVVLSYILRNFKVTSTQRIDNVNPVQDIVLRPSEGLFVILEERNK
ncbi:cytochrome p450 family 4 [Holotrichia oblita]|uniref:Cytochrome p450 family 4 n=1 Tax=Holotrichia oblita TaxID=644536 RepID=A0ACB9T7M8_HOLOL|nr:cytochrome p450 family 4 [Holotrichia oblita]